MMRAEAGCEVLWRNRNVEAVWRTMGVEKNSVQRRWNCGVMCAVVFRAINNIILRYIKLMILGGREYMTN